MPYRDFFEAERIEYFREIPASALRRTNEAKWQRLCEKTGTPESCILFVIPYHAGKRTTNLSVYAMPRDYHFYMKQLSERFEAYFREKFPAISVQGFADSSPIDERDAALKAGLGVMGKNGLVLNEKYGSYFFIGEFFLSKALSPSPIQEKKDCVGCGSCLKSCPTGAILDPERKKCLSLLTQKKNRTEEEDRLVEKAACKWGCDLCQTACPMNKNAALTPIEFFRTSLVELLTEKEISLPKTEFSSRAFSWRGREILRKNLKKER